MTGEELSVAGLVAYVLSIVIGGALLAFDARQWLTGKVTITEWVTERPLRAAGVVAATSLGVVGLGVHFVFFRN